VAKDSEEIDGEKSDVSEPALYDGEESELPPIDEESEFSALLSPGVSEELRKRALRRLFHAQVLNRRDGLDDYDDDYRSFKPMEDMVTAHTRHQMERLARDSGDHHPDEANPIGGDSPASLSRPGRGREEGTEGSDVRKDRTPPGQRSALAKPAASLPDRCLHSGEEQRLDMDPASPAVTFRSTGHLLIIGEQARGRAMAARLAGRLRCTLIVHSPAEAEDSGPSKELPTLEGARMLQGTAVEVTGYLGAFEVTFRECAGAGHPEQWRLERGDLVLDLTTPPRLRHELSPPGYHAPGKDPEALQRALEELPDLVGEFEKPRFVRYDPSGCAHGNARVRGCRKCIEVCPAGAISSGKSAIEINHHLCHGCFICATACPTAAITESSTATRDRVQDVAADLRHHRAGYAASPCVLFHDRDMDGAELACLQSAPLPIVNVRLEEIGSIGMDIWLVLLACGASHVLLRSKAATPFSVLRELELQRSQAATILAGMGYEPQRLQVIVGKDRARHLSHVLKTLKPEPEIPPISFADLPGKRAVIRRAVQHLYEHAESPLPMVDLPEGGPFGAVEVDPIRCTLCMACAGICPVSAISGGDAGHQLRFFESECVQCGLCRQACPEQAIRLVPRMRYQVQADGLLLHQEEPFHCVCCGAPFTTRKMVDRLTEKLTGHWMFQDDAARRRLQMCKQCRLQDMFDRQEATRVHR
jgi:ferredoxin